LAISGLSLQVDLFFYCLTFVNITVTGEQGMYMVVVLQKDPEVYDCVDYCVGGRVASLPKGK
jgi:hypothetical protein